MRLPQSSTVQQLLDHIHKDFGYKQGSYKLLCEYAGAAVVSLAIYDLGMSMYCDITFILVIALCYC